MMGLNSGPYRNLGGKVNIWKIRRYYRWDDKIKLNKAERKQQYLERSKGECLNQRVIPFKGDIYINICIEINW